MVLNRDLSNIGKEEGMAKVDGGVTDEWKALAAGAIFEAAKTLAQFTTDDVWVLIGVDEDINPMAMGPAMRRAYRAGFISPTSESRMSDMVVCHRREKKIWKSEICCS